jgi:hypothetical protein
MITIIEHKLKKSYQPVQGEAGITFFLPGVSKIVYEVYKIF